MGHVRQQSPRQVLHADPRRTEAGRAGDARMGAHDRDPRALSRAPGEPMRTLRAWIRRLAGTVAASRREREMADEIASHLQLHVDDNVRAGMTPDEARRQALLKFGGMEAVKEEYRD